MVPILQQPLTLLEKRRAQAALMLHVYEVLRAKHVRQEALQVIADAVEADALIPAFVSNDIKKCYLSSFLLI